MQPKEVNVKHHLPQELNSYRQEMLDLIINCAKINSGSLNVSGVNKVLKFYKDEFSQSFSKLNVNVVTKEIKLNTMEEFDDNGKSQLIEVGNALTITKVNNNKSSNFKPIKVLLVGHMDTVFNLDHPFQKVQFINDNILNGPGVADMKGGITVMLTALKLFEQTEFANLIDWQVLLTPDEEHGSYSSGPILADLAKTHDVGLIFEPSLDETGTLSGQRKGSGEFNIVAHGIAAHAGRAFNDGRNAIYAMIKIIKEIHELNGKRQDLTINVGRITGGYAINIVPDLCAVKIGVRYPNIEDEQWVRKNIQNIVESHSKSDGFKIELHSRFSRRPKHIIGDTLRLYNLVKEVGLELNQDIKWQSTGGVCDGNNLFEHGLPNVDTLGVRGGKIHSKDEYLVVDSLVERASLTLGILIKLSSKWQKSKLGETK